MVLLALAACASAMMLSAGPLAGSAQAPAAQRGAQAADTNRIQQVAVGKKAARRHRDARRVGGTVRKAWPATGRKPRTRQVRWLARQVGAITARPCARNWRQARTRCRPGRTGAAAMSALAGDPGSPPGHVARIAAAVSPGARETAVAGGPGTPALPLKLVRSYSIPVDDPFYNRLLDWAWTYDSAVAATAFVATGDTANAAQVLDQLAALQYTDGSLELAFNTVTGKGASVFRSGTVAWLGLAAASYDQAVGADRYIDTQQRAADYLLSLQTTSGLIQGGPDVTWVSTQHNLVALTFLAKLAGQLNAAGRTTAADRYENAASTIAAAIFSKLLVSDSSGTRFLQGLNDTTKALDVQALGVMYLQGIGQPALAAQVLAYAQRTFALSGRSVTKSSSAATYNMTYASSGPFTGYAPYAGTGTPDVRWAEGSAVMRLATSALGQSTSALDTSIANWAAITPNQGALQSDRTVTSDFFGYHVWPASTAAAWTVLSRTAPAFFAAPLPPATKLIDDWTKLRGSNNITTYPDGRVDMIKGGGERRVHAASTASDYSVTSNATLVSGTGYGIYVRANVDTGTKLTGYCVQLDRDYSGGQIVVSQLQSDFELSTPIASLPVPAGFTWYGVPHTLFVRVKGNTMNITLDGTQAIQVADLAAASAASVASSSGSKPTITLPAKGGYGVRAWSNGLVRLQQMTVGSTP